MSVNLKVPKETYGGGETTRSLAGVGLPTIRGGKVKTSKRKKSPSSRLKGGTDDVSSNRTGGLGPSNPRAKSRSPNPSFNSVLSRVKDWEFGAFTPKTALRDNVDVTKSNQPFSNSSVDSIIDGKNRNSFENMNKSDFEPWKPSPTGSPVEHITETLGGTAANLEGSAMIGDLGQATGGGIKPASSVLLKSTLNSNIGIDFKLFLSNLFSFFRYCDVYVFLFSKINGLLGDMDIRIANKYRLGRKIGGGSFGDIYLGKLEY